MRIFLYGINFTPELVGIGKYSGELAAWLSEGKASTHVAAFVTAPEEFGGEGALCVLLAGQADGPRRV